MSIGQTIKHIGTILLITLAVAAQAQQAQTYEVAGCEFLNMREGPASTYPINQRLQRDEGSAGHSALWTTMKEDHAGRILGTETSLLFRREFRAQPTTRSHGNGLK
jgi:hypothetical protein